MTTLEELLKKSRIITIEGNRNSGKSTFIFYLMMEIFKENITIFSPIEDTLFERKLKIIKKNFKIFENLTSRLKFYFLDESWLESKQLYGFDFFREELERLIKNSSNKYIYLHRFGEFFELQDLKEVEPTFAHIMKIAEEQNKKLIFSLNAQSPVYNKISPALKDFSDITLFMKELSLNERLVEVVTSITPLFYHQYLFVSSNNILAFMRYDEEEIKLLKERSKIALLTTNPKLQKFFNYIFEEENVIDFHILESFPKKYGEILKDLDLLLLNSEDNHIKIEVPEYIRRNSLKTKVFYLSNKEVYREIDKQISYKQGFDKVFPSKFSFEDMIFSIEKEIKRFFYFDKFEKIIHNKTLYEDIEEIVYYDKKKFFKKLKIYTSNRIFFTAFIYKIENDMIDKINYANLVRDYDSIYIDKENKQLIILAINSRAIIKDKIEERLKREGISFKEIKRIEAQDLEF